MFDFSYWEGNCAEFKDSAELDVLAFLFQRHRRQAHQVVLDGLRVGGAEGRREGRHLLMHDGCRDAVEILPCVDGCEPMAVLGVVCPFCEEAWLLPSVGA